MEKAEVVEGKVDWRGRTARKDKHGGMRSTIPILAIFGFENLATLALAVNLVTYFNGVMHFNVADASNQVTNYMGVSYILTILVAILADAYIGRFKAVLIAAAVELVGLGLLAIQAHYPKLKPSPCNIFDPTTQCAQVSGGNAAILFVSLYLVGLGSGGIKAAMPSHGSDQFDEKDQKEASQMSSFFNWVLLAACLGGAVSATLVVWIQANKGWDLGFGISTFAMFIGAVLFFSGLPFYRIHVIQGSSVVIEMMQVYVAALRNRKLQLPDNSAELYEINRDKEVGLEKEFLPHSDAFRFLDKAAVFQSSQTQLEIPNQWKLCTVTQVENAKIILGMVPIFCCTIIMTLCLAQLQTFSISQGLTMDTSITNSFHIPPASLPIFPIIFLIILIPIYDQIFVPFARKITGNPTGITHLQRVGAGLVLSSVSMAAAAILEIERKKVARTNNMLDAIPVIQPLPITVFWLSFQYSIFGVADLFTYIGLLEFFLSQAPKGLKSISSCFLWSSMALGYFLSTIIVKIVNSVTKGTTSSGGWLAGNNINRNHLNLFYWLLSVLSLVNFFIYLFVAKRYKYRHKSLEDQIGTQVHELNDMKLLEKKPLGEV